MNSESFYSDGICYRGNTQELWGGILVLDGVVLLLAARCSDVILMATVWYVIWLMVGVEKDHAVDVNETVDFMYKKLVCNIFLLSVYLPFLYYSTQLLSIKYKY